MKTAKTFMVAALAAVLLALFSGTSLAGTISCGDCHSIPPTDSDNCTVTARGLHGTHSNYSSASYPKTVASYGKCAYCHTSTTDTTPTDTHMNFYINVTSTAKAPGLDYDSASSTCANACHRNAGATAKWGNYTSVATIKLSCTSCHGDATGDGVGLSAGAGSTNKGHVTHFTKSWLAGGVKIVLGSYSGYMYQGSAGGNTNAMCVMCHPDNRSDLWSQGRADDGSKKAYPHASDGTNVVSKNAAVGGYGNIVFTNSSGIDGTTTVACTNSCHFNKSSYQTADPKWNGTWVPGTGGNCSVCHQHKASYAINRSSNVPLTYAHGLHFANLSTTAGLVSCNVCHASVHTNYAGSAKITRLPVTPGYAGLNASVGWSKPGVPAVDGTCTNSCHLIPSPQWNTVTDIVCCSENCAICHEYPNGNNWTAGNGHAIQNDPAVNQNTHLGLASSYSSYESYAAVTSDPNKCGKCHSGGTHLSGTVDVSGSGFNNCGVGNFTVNVNASGSDVTCSSVSCHSGKTTPNWW